MNRPQPFHQHHIARLLKAASRAGLRDPSVHIRLQNGTEYTVGSDFAKGGSTRMFGPQSAGQQKPGVTAHAVKSGAKQLASGGPKTPRGPSLAMPAAAGRTAPPKKGR